MIACLASKSANRCRVHGSSWTTSWFCCFPMSLRWCFHTSGTENALFKGTRFPDRIYRPACRLFRHVSCFRWTSHDTKAARCSRICSVFLKRVHWHLSYYWFPDIYRRIIALMFWLLPCRNHRSGYDRYLIDLLVMILCRLYILTSCLQGVLQESQDEHVGVWCW